MSGGDGIRWTPDQDAPDSVDDLFATSADVHLERMDTGYYWLCITVGGKDYHFDLHTRHNRTLIRAFARQPAPNAPPAQQGGGK